MYSMSMYILPEIFYYIVTARENGKAEAKNAR